MGRRHEAEPKLRPLDPGPPGQGRRPVPWKGIATVTVLIAVVVAGAVWINSRSPGPLDLTAVPIGLADEYPVGLVREVVLDIGYTDTVGLESPPSDLVLTQEVQQTRLFVLNHPGEGLVALSQRSPFRGCRLVEVSGAEAVAMLGSMAHGFDGGFFDPCHGGLFASDGTKRSGPGDRNLTAFALQREPDGLVTVDLTSVHTTSG